MPKQNISVWQQDSFKGRKAKSINAFIFNYDFTATSERDRRHLAGIQDFKYAYDDYIFAQSVFLRYEFYGKNNFSKIRLDTNVTHEDENKMVKWRIGDSISSGASWSSSTRFGGFQYTTDFSLNPNLITYPLISFDGRADLPTTLDVYANSNLIYKTELQTGDFNMENLPVAAGKGSVEIKQQDITGKIKTIRIPYYSAPSLLKEGLSDYSVEIGSQRQNYGSLNNQYRYLITSFDYNKGVSSKWTTGFHFESMKDSFATGVSNLYKIGNYGVISLDLATSGPKLANAQKFILGYTFQSSKFGFSAQQTLTGRKFVNVFDLSTSGVRNATQGSISYALNDTSSIGLSYLKVSSISQEEKNTTEMLMANYQTSVTKNSSLGISVGADMKDRKNIFASLSFGINLGRTYISSNIYKDKESFGKYMSISSNGKNIDDINYRVNMSYDEDYGYDMQFEKSFFDKTDATLYLFDYGDYPIRQLSLVGSVAATPKGIFASKIINDGFAVTKVADYENIDIYHNNKLITKTDKNGVAFIPDIPSYINSKITIDEGTLPLSASFADNIFIVNPRKHSGIYAEFDITRVKIVEMTLVNNVGELLTPDHDVIIEDIEEELFTGYDGKLYIPDLGNLTKIKGEACKGDECCYFNVVVNDTEDDEILDLGKQICE